MQAGGRMPSKQNARSAIKRAYAKVRVTQWAPEMEKKMMKGRVNTFWSGVNTTWGTYRKSHFSSLQTLSTPNRAIRSTNFQSGVVLSAKSLHYRLPVLTDCPLPSFLFILPFAYLSTALPSAVHPPPGPLTYTALSFPLCIYAHEAHGLQLLCQPTSLLFQLLYQFMIPPSSKCRGSICKPFCFCPLGQDWEHCPLPGSGVGHFAHIFLPRLQGLVHMSAGICLLALQGRMERQVCYRSKNNS